MLIFFIKEMKILNIILKSYILRLRGFIVMMAIQSLGPQ